VYQHLEESLSKESNSSEKKTSLLLVLLV
jgi:hypothetical protein